ncbi:MAG: PEP-utilizing enzyme [Aestuariivita sp.]|nr:PEP-utilizing enzyme [Aestuariivita sp.]MCY4346641.1 PEP-utilizing enzyme [Aestuariivita sp.]
MSHLDTLISVNSAVATTTHGWRANFLQHLVDLALPVPMSVALSFDTVHRIAEEKFSDIEEILESFPVEALVCIRPSPQDSAWGGPSAILSIGMNDEHCKRLMELTGEEFSADLYSRFIQNYALQVDKIDTDLFSVSKGTAGVREALQIYQEESGTAFPQLRKEQVFGALRAMAQAWESTSARLLREAKGAPSESKLGLIIQEMISYPSGGEFGNGTIQLADPETGHAKVAGNYCRYHLDQSAISLTSTNMPVERNGCGLSLEECVPKAFAQLHEYTERVRAKLQEETQLTFQIQGDDIYLLDGRPAVRSAQAAVRIAVQLAQARVISREDAIMRIEPNLFNELLHRQVAPDAVRDVLGSGIAASPGAAVGQIVFSSAAAQASAARGEPCILVRRETSPEDIRGMHAAAAVLTERGGVTSHAAVIGRGMGLPCVVGASRMTFRFDDEKIIAEDGRILHQNDVITIDGSSGQVLAGEPRLLEAFLDDAFKTLMAWADDARDIEIRANADTPEDARTASNFESQGIGLCRTEHMFFDSSRLTVMREMIFAETAAGRAAVLARLLPMQRDDFVKLFQIMEGRPVCIRLFDPPLHEFLPTTRTGQRELSNALDIPLHEIQRRVTEMAEYNPMLGLRGVRLGVTVPEIYEMQAQAILEATFRAHNNGAHIVPEIMIPLVSARREVELIKNRIDAVQNKLCQEHDFDFNYRLGVMVETPRAALQAGEFANLVEFLSFGTNDLTQMTYGLSRDDAGRFMSTYVQQGVFREDPFRTLDTEGVGELLRLGVKRALNQKPNLTLSICGEHGGNPESIAFCRGIGIHYVSCSPFRVPVARICAAQLAISERWVPTDVAERAV